MKFAFAILLCLPIFADTIDLGELTEAHALEWERPTNTLAFKLIFLPQNSPTNAQVLVLTNATLTVDDLRHVPDGLVDMEMASILVTGTESPAAQYRFDLHKAAVVPMIRKVMRRPPPLPGSIAFTNYQQMRRYYATGAKASTRGILPPTPVPSP